MCSADGVCATHSNRKNNYSYQKKELRSEAGRGSWFGGTGMGVGVRSVCLPSGRARGVNGEMIGDRKTNILESWSVRKWSFLKKLVPARRRRFDEERRWPLRQRDWWRRVRKTLAVKSRNKCIPNATPCAVPSSAVPVSYAKAHGIGQQEERFS